MKYTFFFGIFCASLAVCLSRELEGYIFTSPRTLKRHENNELTFRRFGSENSAVLNVQVFYKKEYNSVNNTIAANEDFEIAEGETEKVLNLPLDLPDDNVYSGTIQINGTLNGREIYGNDSVTFSSPRKSIVIIQTDKPLYRPGETVQFRVLQVDRDLKPSQNSFVNVYVEDPQRNRLFQFLNLDSSKGLVQEQFKLSDDLVYGSWSLVAEYGGTEERTNFDVKEYVLPKFDVTITFPPFVLSNAKTVPVTVCAKYTYGAPVTGTLSLNASLQTFFYELNLDSTKVPTKEITTPIKGCYTYDLQVKDIESDTSYFNLRGIVIGANVTEDGTGVIRSASSTLNRNSQPLQLTFTEGQDYYKPGLPYNGKLKVSNPDNTIASGEPIGICITVNKRRIIADWWGTKTIEICRNYTSCSQGFIPFTILPQNVDVISIVLTAKSLRYDPATNKDIGNEPNKIGQPYISKYLRPYYSPSKSFLQIQPLPQPVTCGSNQNLKVLFTSEENGNYKFYYQVIYQSNVVLDSSIETSFSTDDDVSAKYEKSYKVINGPVNQLDPPKDAIPQDSVDSCPDSQNSKYLPPIGEISIDIDAKAIESPTIRVLAYYVKETGEVIADSIQIDVESCFNNQVQVSFGNDVAQPGAETTISVTSGPNSLCGIKAIDKSVLLLDNNDQLTKEKVFQLVSQFDSNTYYQVTNCYQNSVQPGLQKDLRPPLRKSSPLGGNSYNYQDSYSAFQTSGNLVISDLYIFTTSCDNTQYFAPIFQTFGAFGRAGLISGPVNFNPAFQSISNVRTNFPETWLFELDMTNEDGTFQKTVTLPDTITDWVGSAVCLNTADGLGISNTTTIKGFQPFFIDYTLPSSVIRKEEFTLVVSIFSYADSALPITVTLDHPHGFKVIKNSLNRDICVQPNSTVTLPVTLKATSVGKVQITVRAESAASSSSCGSSSTSGYYARDAIRKPIEVKPEGFPNEKVINKLICAPEKVTFTNISLNIPKDVVPHSTRAYVEVTGNVLGPAINNLDNLVSLPTGCGEQNMVRFTPNYLVLDYLNSIGQLSSSIKERAISNLISGYQRELTYRRGDGSFSAFGDTDNEGSMFLTAFVLRSFYEAKRYIFIDDKIIEAMQNWIVSKQDTTGCFPNVGKIIDIGLQGGVSKENSVGSITAYVLSSLLISNYKNKTDASLDNAVNCLKSVAPTNPYSQFLYAYAYSLAGDTQEAKDLIDEARQKINSTEGMESFIIENGTIGIEIETDAYAVLTTLSVGESASDALPYVRFLTSNLNPNGGFTNTQDTCVGLSALARYASVVYNNLLHLDVNIRNDGLRKFVRIDDNNKPLVQRFKVKNVTSSLDISWVGEGCGLIQVPILYNTKTAPETKKFSISVRGECSDQKCNNAKIVTLISYLPPGQVAGMSIVEIKLITGFSPVKQSLDDLKKDRNNKILRIDVQDNTVIMYLSEVSNNVENLSFEVNQVVKVQNAQPGTAKVYDYYANENSATTNYKINSAV